jgi:hypothetical protein
LRVTGGAGVVPHLGAGVRGPGIAESPRGQSLNGRRRTISGLTPDEVETAGALLMGAVGALITGSDILMDGGVTAAYWFGELAPK